MHDSVEDESDNNMIFTALLYTVTAILLFVFGVKVLKSLLSDSHVRMISTLRTHSWKSLEILNGAYFCNVCEILVAVSGGLFCDSCGVFAHGKCSKRANQQFSCKTVSQPSGPVKHHWVRGNLHPDSVCDVCEADCECGMTDDVRCCWCQRSVHEKCRNNIAEVCDFGAFKSLIVPPSSVQVVHHKNRLRRRLVIKSISAPSWSEWNPLIVIANAKSGSSEAENAVSLFRKHLNPAQVTSLSSVRPESALEFCRLLKDVRCRVLVAGGDGTVAWVLNTLNSMKLSKPPAVAILPFGTGNDLSRVLEWGSGVHTSEIEPENILNSLLAAETVPLDRWMIRLTLSRSLPLKPSSKDVTMYNYAGFGVDAQVALSFHRTRESPLYLFNSRLFNKMLYVCFGTGEIIEKTNQNLQNVLDVFLDGVRVELPSIEGIVILNIDSFGAGMHLWKMTEEEHKDGIVHSINDKKLEVVAFFSSFHMGGLQMGVGTPYRVGQARSVKVVLHRETAMQVDGEPWMQSPAEIVFKTVNQALLLKAPTAR